MSGPIMTGGSRTAGSTSSHPSDMEREFAPDPGAARDARQFVLDSGWSDDEEANLRLATVVSELVTNAILHARTPFTVKVRRLAGTIRVDVTDKSEEMPVRRPHNINEVTGRGLQIVEKLSDNWGVSKNSRGKTVWFELAKATP